MDASPLDAGQPGINQIQIGLWRRPERSPGLKYPMRGSFGFHKAAICGNWLLMRFGLRHPKESSTPNTVNQENRRTMISYVTVGTNDYQRAAEFYDAVLDIFGISRLFETDTFCAWGSKSGGAKFCLTKPHDGNTATIGNGMMVALTARSTEAVDAVHKKAIELGAKDEGAPGPRGSKYYIGYFRDLDGNKLCAFHSE
jgi:predicted lactoylglutathione lyase